MRRLGRHLFTLFCLLSLLLAVAVGVLWVRGRGGADEVEWRCNRRLADGSVVSRDVQLSFDKNLWAFVEWGTAPASPPRNHNLAYYYVNADRSGGQPHWHVRHRPYVPGAENDHFMPEPLGGAGWGPLRWRTGARGQPAAGGNFHAIRLGVAHWLPALLLLAAPMLWLIRWTKARRVRRRGLCPKCGYDLRESPERCPECGAAKPSAA